jgi:glutamate N-acetyltransferase/amino-acid N-acetyltransferase
VIGEPLPVERVVAGVPGCVAVLDAGGWTNAARGIMTTDTLPKGASRRVALGGETVTVTGIAKGAGMLRPDMATMLAFVATDAPVAASVLQVLIHKAVERSFNRITVDGDTSTNDACVLMATGRSGGAPIASEDDPRCEVLFQEILRVCESLAQALVRDAEGATKFITVTVTGGASERDCLRAAYTVAESPLVKTAFFASDPNWGRILAAVGRAGLDRLEIERVAMHLGNVRILVNGGLDPEYREADGRRVMAEPEIAVRIDLGVGTHGATVWTCDLSYEYVRINAEYRT